MEKDFEIRASIVLLCHCLVGLLPASKAFSSLLFFLCLFQARSWPLALSASRHPLVPEPSLENQGAGVRRRSSIAAVAVGCAAVLVFFW
jgi:hypothetical protein